MTTDTRPFEEMNTITKQIKEQALIATDDYFKFLKKSLSSLPARGSEVGDVLKSSAERNIDLVQEYVHKFSEAKDFYRTPCECKQSSCSLNSPHWESKPRISARRAANQLRASLISHSRTSPN
jgi:hypothetical protein